MSSVDGPPDAATRLEDVLANLQIISDQEIFPLMLQTIFFSLMSVLAVYFVFLNRKKYMLAIALSLYGLAAGIWAIDIYLTQLQLYRIMPNIDYDSAALDAANATAGIALFMRNLFISFTWTISDAVVLWRAIVLLGQPRWLYTLAGLIMAADITLYTLLQVHDAVVYLPNPSHSLTNYVQNHFELFHVSGVFALSLTAFAQAFSTALIGFKAWKHWSDVRRYIDGSMPRGTVALYALVVESGIFYTALWITYAVLNSVPAITVGVPNAVSWSDIVMVQTATLYPMLVVVLVATRSSMLERSICPSPSLEDSMEFAAAPAGFSSTQTRSAPAVHFRDSAPEGDAEKAIFPHTPVCDSDGDSASQPFGVLHTKRSA